MCVWVIQDMPVDSVSTAFITAGSRPSRLPAISPSAVDTRVTAVIVLLMDFMTWPDPTAPRWNIFLPIT